MQPPDRLLQLLRQEEGLAKVLPDGSIVPYTDMAGYWTIGYGHRCTRYFGPIDQDGAETILVADAQLAMSEAVRLSPVLAHFQNKLIAVSDFVFNLGSLAYETSHLRKYINAGEWQLAADEFPKWVYAAHKMVEDLIKRRALERQIFLETDNG